MTTLNTGTNLADHDGIYQRLVALHEGLSDEESARANARLILLLINHIGDLAVIEQAIALARKGEK
jgi:hypothetical protein